MDDDAVQSTSPAEVVQSVTPANCVVRLGARGLSIAWGSDRRYWSWIQDSTALHSEVAQLKSVSWFDASGEIKCLLPPGAYTLSWRIRLDKPLWWDSNPVHFRLSKDGEENVDQRKCFMTDSVKHVEHFRLPTIRVLEHGWREYEVGEFVVESGERICHLKFAMQSLAGDGKSGISLDGVVVQPTSAAHETPGMSVDGFDLQPSSSAQVQDVSAETLSLAGDEHGRAPEQIDDSIDRQSDDVAVQPTEVVQSVTPANCVRLGARGLRFAWGCDHTAWGRFWSWIKDPTALHSVVAQLNEVKPFDASGDIKCLLAPGAYTLSWRIRLDKPLWWDSKPVHFTLSKDDVPVSERKCVLSKSYMRVEHFKVPTIRVVENGWREYEVGEFIVESGERMCQLKFAMVGDDSKTGISLDGVVVQPTSPSLHVSAEALSRAGDHISHVTSCPCDPFYPYFHYLPCQSTGRGCSTCRAEIPVWRALVDSEVGVESRLRKSFQPSTVETLLGQYNEGIRAQEEGNWGFAEYSFSELRRDIVCSVGQLEKQDYDFLLAWADLPLAQLFQFRGGADMLNSAMNLRQEVLECVMPLHASHESLVRVCKTFFFTAQYEWGAAVTSSETRNDAILGYATLMSCNEDEAEAQLCFLLCVDHEYSGSFKKSSRWIQEANRLWKNIHSPDEGNSCRFVYFLRYEAQTLMNLGNYQEAVNLLEDSIHSIQDLERLRKVHKMLEECVTEIRKGTTVIDDSQVAVYNEKLAESQRRLQRSLDGVDYGVSLIPSGTANRISDSHDPIETPKPCPIGSSLGLVQAYGDMEFYHQGMSKLPEPVTLILQSCLQLASDAHERCDWKWEIFNYEQIRELLKITKRYTKVDLKIYNWLLSWFDLPLAHLYQYRAREFVRAQKIWKEMLSCAGHQMGSGHDQAVLTQGYQLMFDAISLEQRLQDPNWTKDDPAAAHEMCFWLYFGHHRFQNWTLALKWLQEAKRLKEEFCSKEDRNCGYLWNDYYYLLGEADLLIHRVNELQPAREFSLLVDNRKHEDRVAEQLPSPTGVILQVNDKLAMQSKLVQSQAGLEHHLHKLPVPYHLAFRIHGNRGCANYDQNEWESAIFDFEWCKEILKLVMKVESGRPEIEEACSWLMVWSSLPLANIYLFKKNQFKKALNLQMEMERMIPGGDSDELRSLKDTLRIARFTTSYQYCVSHLKNVPDLKEQVVREFGGAQRPYQDEKASENYLLTELFNAYMDHGNFNAALGFIQEAKKFLSSEDDGGISNNVELEAFCDTKLGMDDTANKLIKSYRMATLKPVSKLPPRMQQMVKVYTQRTFTHDKSQDSTPSKQQRILKILKSILNDNERWNWESLDKEVQSYEKLSYVDPTDTKGKMALENELDYGDYLLLSGLRVGLCLRTIESLNPDQINSNQMKAFCEEKNFQRAVMYCEKCMELSPDSDKSLAIARSNFFLAQLYGALDSKNHEYLLFLIEKVSQTKDGKSWNDNVSVPESLLNEELCSYFSRELTPVQKYGKAAGTAYSRLLETANYSEDQWLRLLEQHKQLYSLLQVYHCRRAELCEFLYKKVDRNSEIIKQRDPWKWAAFMYAEGERSQSMLYQLLDSDKISRSFKWSFDASIGFKTGMQNVHRALPPRGVFVQYSNLVENGRAFIIYVCDTEKNLRVIKCDVDPSTSQEPRSLVDRLDAMYKHLDPTKKDLETTSGYNDDSLEKDLEFLYDLLIRPIAYELDKMDQNHPLILAPNELFTKVPFAALRDRRTGKYLIESHTISLTPSLRVLRACTERLQELQGAPLRTGDPGSIVALGNPTYTCSKCRSVGRKRLPGTEEEVNVIAKMFQTETQVVSLLGDNATARELVRWAAQPSETGLRQAVLHIGSHGQFDKDDHRKNVLHLACDPASGKDHVSLSSADGARGQPVDGFVSSDEDDEPDTTMDFPMSYRICMDSVVLTSRNDSRKIRGADSSDYSHGLTAEFISGSDPKWRAELVVLSACQTSRGKVTTEGVLSMARSFIIAGVPCVVASLWKIGDEATIKLMEVFYEALRRDASVARALRFAMVRRLREDPQIKVADWAPFNVWGDPSLCIPRELQLQGRGARSLHHDPIPRFVVQNQQTLQRRWFDSLGRTPRPDTDYDELYGHRDDKPYDSIFYDPSTITRSKIAQEMNSMYKWSWFKDHDNVLQDALP